MSEITVTQEKTLIPETTAVQELIARIHEIGPLLQENAPQADRDRRVPDSSVEALDSIGAFGINTPQEWGGLGEGARALFDAATAIAQYCPNAAWITVISNVSAKLVLRFPTAVQERVFQNKPVKMSSIIVSPRGGAERDGEGYRIFGEWPFASNCLHAEWAVLIVPVTESPGAEPVPGYVVVHKDQFTIKDTWFTIGMRGSGSNTIVIDDTWVPDDQVIRADHMLGPAVEADPEASFLARLTPPTMFPTMILSSGIGAAQAALDLTASFAAKRGVTYSKYSPANTSGAFAQAVGRIQGKIDASRLLLQAACDRIDEAARIAEPLAIPERARVRNDLAFAVDNMARAMDEIAWLHGTATFGETNPIGRMWRDVNTGIRHAMAAAPLGYEIGGAAKLGVELPTNMV